MPRSFAGREDELGALRAWREENTGRLSLVVLSGPPGVGKTSLALRWLHEVRDDCPDGALAFDLGGTAPVAPTDVLDWFLVSLGVPANRVPVEQTRREALYRSVSSTRRLLVLLDNAVSATQVRALIPAGERSMVVVTSRFRLSGLAMDGAHWVEVTPLDEAGSLLLLRRTLGRSRLSGESEAARDVVTLCGGLPLALSVVAARLATRPRRRLGREVAELREERRRLAALTLDRDRSVEAVLDVSYGGLGEDAANLYRMCGSHPGREFGVDVTAAAAGWSVDRAESTLDSLVEANFINDVGADRFAYHDLLRLHAQRRAEEEDPPERRGTVLFRMIDWYLGRTVAADLTIHPLRPRLGPRYADARPAELFAGERDALSWLEMERRNLRAVLDTAASENLHELVWQICEALWGFFLRTRHYGDWIDMHRTGIASAQRCGNRRAEARLRSQLGFAQAKLRRYDDAIAENTTALRLAEAEGDEQASATALSQLGRAARGGGDLPGALRYFQRARDIQHRLREWRGVALCRRRIGDVLSRLGQHEEAATELHAAAQVMAELDDRPQQARTLMFLGAARLRAGRADLAESALRDALSLTRDLGSPYYQAEVLARLGEAAEQAGDLAGARQHYGEAATLYEAVEDPKAQIMRSRLAAPG